MSKYGLTDKGPNIKRLDVIIDEIHEDLSREWGVNTKQNPESFLNHLITNFADKLAELWEFGENVYYSKYPSYAEGVNLDNAAQYGGTTRGAATKSYYPIHCTGKDGTILTEGTTIATTTNPSTLLTLSEEKVISKNSFNKIEIKITSAAKYASYTIILNEHVISVFSMDDNEIEILNSLKESIENSPFTATVDESKKTLTIEADDIISRNTIELSENLDVVIVTSVITFGTVETGDIVLPNKTITSIVKADAGLEKVVNIAGYIAGRNEETDEEFRQSYIDKIFNRSSMMLESIRSAILNNVQDVKSVAPYENATSTTDEYGRPPHSIEIVVDGGDSKEIAQQILRKKAGGIITYGDTTVVLAGEYDEDIQISFSRPSIVYTWYRIGITRSKTQDLPENFEMLLTEVILKNMDKIEAGRDIIPQEFVSDLYKACKGITYIDIGLFGTTNPDESPESYSERSLSITAKQRAYTAEHMIEVVVDA